MALPLRDDPAQNQMSNQSKPVDFEERSADDAAREQGAASNDLNLRQLQRNREKLDAETAEEIDALRVNLLQDDDMPARDGSGRLIDEVAEEDISRFTEVGPLAEDRGAESVVPGRDDPSRTFQHDLPDREIASVEVTSSESLDEPRDEEFERRKSA